jgi:hypothetical protein
MEAEMRFSVWESGRVDFNNNFYITTHILWIWIRKENYSIKYSANHYYDKELQHTYIYIYTYIHT